MILPRKPFTKLADLFVQSSAAGPPLRVGILLDGSAFTRIFAELVRDIRRSNFASLELLIFCRPDAAAPAPKRARLSRTLGWDLYCRWDRSRFPAADDPLAHEDCGELLSGIPSLDVSPVFEGCAQRLTEDAVSAVRAQSLDVLLYFGEKALCGEILHAARHGTWAFHYGDSDDYRGGPAHFWEIVDGNPLSGAELLTLHQDPASMQVLQKALFPTHPSLSLIQNRIQPCWSSGHFVIQKLWEAREYGWEKLKDTTPPAGELRGKGKIGGTPSNGQVARWLLSTLPKKVVGRIRGHVRRSRQVLHWRIAIRSASEQAGSLPLEMDGFRWIESPKGHYYADPFLFERDGAQHLFFEDFSYQQGRAVIAHAELSPSGEMGPVRTVLDTGSHASYPCVVAAGDRIYMVPETIRSGGVRLYRATRFPYQWEQEAELFRGPAVDTTVWQGDGLWWFFTTLREPRGQGTALYLFWSDSLTGQWHYHPGNPISFDVRRARGAGNVFSHRGLLLRPSQDCSVRYGRAFAFNRVLKLTPDDYREELQQVIEPAWSPGLLSTHTYNRSGNIEVTDGECWRPRASVRQP